MINYSSYNEVWGLSTEKDENNKYIYEKMTNKDNCCDLEHILNCPKCVEKIKKKLNIRNNNIKENFEKSNKVKKFNEDKIFFDFTKYFTIIKENLSKINNMVKIFLSTYCDNKIKKNILLFLLIFAFIIISFLFIKDRGIKIEDNDVEALADAVNNTSNIEMKYLKDNFIMIPKNIINLNPNL